MDQVSREVREPETFRRRASDQCPLTEIVAEIEQAFRAHDFPRTADLIERQMLSAWYGFTPDRFREIVSTLMREDASQHGILHGINLLITSTDPGRFERPEQAMEENEYRGTPRAAAMIAARMFAARLQGQPVEAQKVSTELLDEVGTLHPILDASGGWGLFAAVQHGVTAMLAGEFDEALSSFTKARLHVVVPALSFLSRDAFVKQAILQACYGDPARAHALLDEADQVSRTESWVEGVVDASAAIAASLVRAADPADALRHLDSVPLHAVGEMWPFYLVALHRALTESGDTVEAERRVDLFGSLPLPRHEGEGFSGSVLPILGATNVMMRRDLSEARSLLERADGTLAITRIVGGVLDLVAGRPRDALQRMAGVHEHTRGLRLLEVWRLSVIAGGHLSLGERDDCRDVLDFALLLPGGLSVQEALHFPADVRRFAEEALPQWPRTPATDATAYYDRFPTSGEALSARELDVLQDLSSGLSREDIAKAQFISINTLKAHLRAIYRKLGVSSRAAALLEAERRGLV